MITIHSATLENAKELLEIYAYYVKHTAITFEYEVPSLEEFQARMKHTLEKYPYLIAKEGNEIVGYAYAGTFNVRSAYDWCVETTIYVKHNCHKKGIGKALYTALENVLKLQGIINLNACIAAPIVEDQYLTNNSIEYHTHLGYQMVGTFHQCGYKFNTWYNMVWMEKMIGDHLDHQPPIKTFQEIKEEVFVKYGF